jgi:hypothetical protein
MMKPIEKKIGIRAAGKSEFCVRAEAALMSIIIIIEGKMKPL